MKLYSENENYKLYNGNMLDMLEIIEPNSIDAIITDPPYELGFMGKSWDSSGIAFNVDAWKKCFEVMKPGAYLLAFGGSRTFHRIACAIEDAGFVIKDTIMWLYGCAMPKGLNIGFAIDKRNGVESIDTGIKSPNARPNGNKETNLYELGTVGKEFTIKKANNEWDGWNTQLKPSYEPVIVAQKPVEKSIIDNVLKYHVGGLNIGECKVGNELIKGGTMADLKDVGRQVKEKTGVNCMSFGQVENAKRLDLDDHFGRYPANVIHDGSDEVVNMFPSSKSSGSMPNDDTSECENRVFGFSNQHKSGYHFNDEGSCARFFYSAKATKFDRDEGLDELESKRKYDRKEDSKSKMERSTVVAKNTHISVKPTELMRYLVRLVSPKGATILDCFNGSGSTGKAVMLENKQYNKNYKYIGIELTDEYLPISQARIEYICNNDFDFWKDEEGKMQRQVKDKSIITLFDL